MHHLQIGERAAEQFSAFRARDGFIERAAGETERRGADGGAENIERRHGDLKAFARRADHGGGRNGDALEFQPRQRMRRDDVDALGDGKARQFSRQQKRREALGAGAFAGAREHHVEVGDAAVGNPGFFAVEDKTVAVALGGQRDIGDVGAGLLLGQREGGDGAAAARAFEPVALLGIAEQADRPGAEALHGEGEIGQAIVARQGLADEAERAHVERCRRVGIGRGVGEPAVAAELLHEIAAGGIDVAMIGRQVGRAPLLEACGQRAMAVGEERPAEESLVRH